MGFFKWFLGGLIGAAIGGAVWVAVGVYTDYEIGYIAWGIGLLAGIGVRIAAGDEDGVGPGVAAVGTAVFVVLFAKYLVISIALDSALADIQNIAVTPMSEDYGISLMANEVAAEMPDDEVDWPEDEESFSDEIRENDYPPEIWQEGKKRWSNMSSDEKTARYEVARDAEREMIANFGAMMKPDKTKILMNSFGPFDLLWFGLAAFTAFKVGSGLTEE